MKSYWLLNCVVIAATVAAVGIVASFPRANFEPQLEERESEPDKLQTQLFMTMLRAWPNQFIDPDLYQKAAYEPSPFAQEGGSLWSYVGPDNMPGSGGQYNGPGPVSGRVNDIAVAPGNNNNLMVASPTGGIHESTDGGATWTALSDDWASMYTSSVAFKPDNANVVLVGMGDYHGFDVAGAIGVMKGVRSGSAWTWTLTGNADFANAAVSKVLFDPENPNIVVASSGRGVGGSNGTGKVFRSTNAGDTWTAVITDLRPWNNVVYGAMSPATGRRIYYAASNGTSNILWRSFDKGKTWKVVLKPIEMTANYKQGVDVAASPTEPEVVYLLSGTDKAIWKSSNGGNKWTRIMNSPATGFPFHSSGTDNYNWSQIYYDWFIRAGTHTDDVSGKPVDDIYVGLITLAHSSDGGATWKDEGHTYLPDAGSYYTHNDQHSLTFVPTNGNEWDEMWVGNDGGIYKVNLNLATGSLTFDPSKNQQLHIAEFYHASWDVQNGNPNIILGGTQDQGSPYNDGASWKVNRRLGDGVGAWVGRGAANGQQKQFTSRIGSASGFSFLSTKDLWAGEYSHSQGAAQPWATLPPLAGDPNNPNIVLSASNRLWSYDISTVVATTVTAGASSNTQTVASTAGMFVGQALEFSHPTIGVYSVNVTGVTNATTVVLDAVIDTTPAGAWTVSNKPWTQAAGNKILTGSSVLSITVAKGDSNWILTGAMDGQIWRTTDAGATAGNWTQINLAALGDGNLPNRPVSDIAINPNNKKMVWVTMQGASTTARVSRCDDITLAQANREWKRLGGNGLPDIPVNCIAVDPDDPTNKIFVGTDMGLYYTGNGGATWSHANSLASYRMPSNVKITDLEVVGTGQGRTLNVATYGRGIWQVSVVTLY